MTLNSGTTAPSPTSSTSSSITAAGTGSSALVNASRLRENQRRSRARKKEYLLSLEARFQACQRTGIEANIEIQIAAKKVVRENQLLRVMLNRRGVTDAEINKTLKEGGEDIAEGETAVEGVLKVLGKRPCGGGGEQITGGASTQCKPSRPGEGQRIMNERRNSTGMVAARETERGGGRGAVNGGAPALAVTTSKLSSPPLLSPHQKAPSNYPTPTSTPMTAAVSDYNIPTPPQINNYYNYNMPSPQSQSPYTSPTISNPSQTYNSYQMSPIAPTPPNNSCCTQPQNTFYPTTQPQCSPSMAVSSSPCCHPQRPMYVTALSSPSSCSYQTAPSISSSTPCHLAQSYISQLHPGLPGENTRNLIDEICPSSMMESSQCRVDNAVLFGVLDRI